MTLFNRILPKVQFTVPYRFSGVFTLLTSLTIVFLAIWLIPRPAILQHIDIMPLWLHIVLELFAIVVAGLVFGIGWHNYGHARPATISLIACVFLAIGFIDMTHMLSFNGMPNFVTPSGREKGLNFWLVARLCFAVLMLHIALDDWQKSTTPSVKVFYLVSSLLFITLIYWLGLYQQQLWPHTFIEGQGLTSFKVATEWFVCAGLAIAAFLFYREATQVQRTPRYDAINLLAAAVVSILSELCFTLYSEVTDIFNLLGHIYKVIAYSFIYRSLFASYIREPYLQVSMARDESEQTKQTLQTIVDTMPVRIFMKDRTGNYTGANKAFLKDTGYHAVEQIIGINDWQLFPNHAERYILDDHQVMTAGVSKLNIEEPIVTANGKQAWILTSKVPLTSLNGEVTGILGTYADITERKQAEEVRNTQVQRTEALLKLPPLAEQLDETAFIQQGQEISEDLTGSQIAFIHFVNDDGESIELITWSRRTLEHYCHAAFDKHYPVSQAGIWADALRQRQPVVFNDYPNYPHKQGLPPGHSELNRLICVPVIENGKVVMLSGVGNKATDYTDLDIETVQLISNDIWRIVQRRRAAANLRRLSLAVEQSPSVIVITDLDARIVYANEAFAKQTGYTVDEVLGKNPRLLNAGKTPKATFDELWQHIQRGEQWTGEFINRRKDGSEYIEWVKIAPVHDAQGKIINYLAIKENITEKKQTASELENYRHHLEELVKQRTVELVVARQQADAANQSKSDFLANMSHEIRTPMNAILGMLHLALKQDSSPTLYNYLNKAQGAAQSLLGIINDILDFSKIESGKLVIETAEFTLDSLLEQLTASLSLQAEQKGIEFLIRYDANLPELLLGDSLRLSQILLNLCNNAIKFTEEGEVELAFTVVRRSASDLKLQISVRDTGIGMSPEIQARVFQKFSQADQSITRQYGGTGLGLAICKNLVELMGGRIWIEDSQPGKGTTICCTVNLQISEHTHQCRHEMIELAGVLLKDVRVLVVDDNEAARDILTGMLHHLHIDAHVAANGLAAIDLLEHSSAKPFDLVLMDWRMPGINGDEAIRRIHNNPTIQPQPKMVMVTAYGREDVIRLAEMVGVNGFIIKPVSPSTLLDTMLSALGCGRLFESKQAGNRTRTERIDFCGARLLLVEDNPINREFAVELLRSMHIQVDEAVNGAEAVEKVQRHDYALVLMDIQMPVMDGLEATGAIRALSEQTGCERFASLPIIAMTALAMAQDQEKSRQAGMNAYITKPIVPEQLVATLARWLPMVQTDPARFANTSTSPQLPADLRALSTLDSEQGIRRIGGSIEAYRKQLHRFKERYANAIHDLQSVIAKEGLTAGDAYCHGLKGVCGNLAANQLFTCISRLNERLRQGHSPDPEQFQEFDRLLRQLIEEINGLDSPTIVQPAATALLKRDELLIKLAMLATLLESNFQAAEQAMMDIQAGVAGSEIETTVAEIAAQVDVFDIDGAQAGIQALQQQLNRSE